jgi:putative tricarboxylic transport membrane protein
VTVGMRRGWQFAAGGLFVICLVWAWQSVQLSLVDRLGPGPGFFPFWLSLLGAVLSAVVLGQVTLARGEGGGEGLLPRGAAAWRVVAILATVAVAAALMDWLGFRLAMLVFNAALLVALGERRWWAVALFALGGSFGVYYVFNNLLDVILPVGVLGI